MFASPDDPPISNPAGLGSFDCEGCIPDSLNNAKFVRDLYEMAHDTGGKCTVPVLWDKKERTIVNNESSEILRMFKSAFNAVATNPTLDLYPEEHRAEIDEMNDWIYHGINNGVYKCGFAKSQAAYDAAFKELFECLDRAEEILTKRRYLTGDALTEADIRLFVTLIRFDVVYVVYFKTDRRAIREFPALSEYVRDLYSTPGIKESVNLVSHTRELCGLYLTRAFHCVSPPSVDVVPAVAHQTALLHQSPRFECVCNHPWRSRSMVGRAS
jgi:putative glutathione S-transferase